MMEQKSKKCMFCGNELQETYSYEEESEFGYRCENCKVDFNIHLPYSDERNDYPYYNDKVEDTIPNEYHGYGGKCPVCDHYIVWMADFMRSEMYGSDITEEEDSVVGTCQCPHCGTYIDIVYPSEAELNVNKED